MSSYNHIDIKYYADTDNVYVYMYIESESTSLKRISDFPKITNQV